MKISVVTATYNSSRTVGDCIDSVNRQSYSDVEHIVVDGGSTDGTVDLVRATASRDAKVTSEPDEGIYDALNKGIARSTGEVIGFLHSDDFYPCHDILANVAMALQDPEVKAVYGDLQYVRKDNTSKVVRHWRSQRFSPGLLERGWMPPHPTLFVKREAYQKIGGFDRRFSISADYHSVLRLFRHDGFRCVYLPQILVKMRVGGASNRSLANIILKSRQDLQALRETGVGGWWTLARKNLSKVSQFV
jgi:glycosyltransferase involved in cell wall biosynthesis